MKQDELDKRKITLLSGLGRTLVISFLVFALAPMAVVGITNYGKAFDNLNDAAEASLRTSAVLKTREIKAYFEELLTDLRHQAEMDSVMRFLEALEDAYRQSGQSIETFVTSYKWALVVDELESDIKKFRKVYSYYDVFLINAKGDILYTVARENDLGVNLFSDTLGSTKFAASVRRSLDTGRPDFSDYEKWAASGNVVSGFMTDAIVDKDGTIIGVIALQFPIGPINDIMQAETGLGKTAETYLVGPDYSLRSNLVLDPERPLISEKVETYQTELLKEHWDLGVEIPGTLEHTVDMYQGPHGKPVLGIHNGFMIREIRFGVIAEIEKQEALARATVLKREVSIIAGATGLIAILFSVFLAGRLVTPILKLSSGAKRVAAGDFSQKITVKAKNEIGELAGAFNAMMDGLSSAWYDAERRDWFKTGQNEFGTSVSGVLEIEALSRTIITFLANYLNAEVGAIYIAGEDNRLRLMGSYAFPEPKDSSREFEFGQGLVGQAALERKRRIVTEIPEDYLSIRSGIFKTSAVSIIISPFMHDGGVVGVVELGAMEPFPEKVLDFLNVISEQIAVTIRTALANIRVRELLKKTQEQARALQESEAELKVQEEELRQTNTELEEQTQALKESEEKLQAQQEELEQINAELEEQSQRLEEQKSRIEQKNSELNKAKQQIEEKATDLELTSRYKSEFLANMSHELRTPLNSILLLSKLLSDNRDGVLTDDHVESVNTIHSSGNELLSLINEVLDLSKVEAGKMELNIARMDLNTFGENLLRSFRPQAEEKGLALNFSFQEDLPPDILTDRQRVEQILRNFLSNAVKFTHKGSVSLEVRRPEISEVEKMGLLPENTMGFYVSDTGIGIPKDKQKVIFEAFQQADGTTSRQYGGTGLGLSISRELAKLLGGAIDMISAPKKGSTFVLYLPEKENTPKIQRPPEKTERRGPEKSASPVSPARKTEVVSEEVADDRKTVQPGDRSILLIEDDPNFLRILRDLSREQGFKCLVAGDGETGLMLAEYHKPSAIILDIGLPGIDGWAVMTRLKENSLTRHIPVHVISGTDRPIDAMKMGAVDFLLKPVSPDDLGEALDRLKCVISKPVKDLLVVEDDVISQQAIAKVIGNGDVKITAVQSASTAYEALLSKDFDCIILDLGLPDMPGTAFLEKIRNNEAIRHIPIIVYTGRELTAEEKTLIDQFSESTIIKGVDSHKKLLDETALFLHRVEADLPEAQQKILKMLHDKEKIFSNKKILVVDDDMRNVYSLKKTLEDKNMRVVVGKNGREGLSRLKENPDIALVLMDIMMPEMDGYEAMRRIRGEQRLKDLPIIALTAKAMKGDRAKCIEAGASDYLAKPVDGNRLLSMMRVWLYGRN